MSQGRELEDEPRRQNHASRLGAQVDPDRVVVVPGGKVTMSFAMLIVGGSGNHLGAIVGGIAIGLVESLSGFYLPEGFKDIAAYVVVLVMLVVRPNGLFGEKLRKKV